MSLGTHVGPHNGNSALEEYIAKKLIRPRDRFLVAAAGNYGGTGVSAKREPNRLATQRVPMRSITSRASAAKRSTLTGAHRLHLPLLPARAGGTRGARA